MKRYPTSPPETKAISIGTMMWGKAIVKAMKPAKIARAIKAQRVTLRIPFACSFFSFVGKIFEEIVVIGSI